MANSSQESSTHSVESAANDLRAGINGFVPHPNDRIMHEALDRLVEAERAIPKQRAGGGDDYRLRMLSDARERMHEAEDRAQALQEQVETLREALSWCNDHRDSPRFHSVAESALNHGTYPAMRSAPGSGATPTQSGASPDGNDGEAGAA